MRIGIFTDSFFPELGGIQDSVAELARELGARGHSVRIVAPHASDKDFALLKLPVQEINLGENVTVVRVPAIAVPSSSQQSRFALPVLRRRLQPLFKDLDVIHTHTFLTVGRAAVRAAKRGKIPLVGTNHWAISEFDIYVPLLVRALVRKLSLWYLVRYYNSSAYITGPSRSTIGELVEKGLTVPTEVVSNPIDTRTFTTVDLARREELRESFNFEDKLVIICAGRLAPEKKVDVVLHAFAKIADEFPTAIVAIAGHGSARGSLELLTKQLNIQDRVQFLGTLPKTRLAELYQAGDVYTIASTSETQSMTLLQAMATGLPAVGVRWRAIPEHISADRGYLFAPDDPADLSEHLRTLLANKELREKMGKNTALYVAQFSIEKIADTWERIYASVLQQK